MLLFLIFGCIACSNPGKEIIGTYETTISTTSDFELDTLVSSDTTPSDFSVDTSEIDSTLLRNSEQSSPELTNQGRTLFLELYEDHQAELKTEFLGNGPVIVQKGTWALLENNRVRTYFIEKDGKFFRDTLTFYRDGLRLVLRGKRSSVTDEVNLIRVNEP